MNQDHDDIDASSSQGVVNQPSGPLLAALQNLRSSSATGSDLMIIRQALEARQLELVQTGGGAIITGGVNTAGGTFIGRDQLTVQLAPGDLARLLPPEPVFEVGPPPPNFVGRTELLRKLEQYVDQGVPGILLWGPPGVGKTAVAKVLADRVKSRFACTFYQDMQGNSDSPVPATEALLHIAKHYRPQEANTADKDQLAGLYMTALRRERVLIFLDNVQDEAQVRTLVPPPGCLLLVTSYKRLAVEGCVSEGVEPLTNEDACALVRQKLHNIGEMAQVIVELCDYLPHAINLVSSTLAERPDLEPMEYVQRLRDEPTRLTALDTSLFGPSGKASTGMQASLEVTYRLLPPEQQKRFCALGVFPCYFRWAGAAAIWNLEKDRALVVLGVLQDYGLVEWMPEVRSYRLLNLTRLFARSKLSEEERADASRRHASYYCSVVVDAVQRYQSSPDSRPQILASLAVDWDNFDAGQAWAAAQPPEDEECARLCRDYALLCRTELSSVQLQRLSWQEAALDAARRLHDSKAEMEYLINLGLEYAGLAITYFEQALSNAGDDRPGRADVFWNMALALDRVGWRQGAIQRANDALTILDPLGDPRATTVRQKIEEWRNST